MNPRRLSLVWKIWLSTSVALTLVFALLGYYLQRSVQETATRSLLEEAKSSAKTYRALWEARADELRTLASLLGAMPETQTALLGHNDAAARQTVMNLWKRIEKHLRGKTFLLLANPEGDIAVGLTEPQRLSSLVKRAAAQFPRQSSGFLTQASVLYQVVVTPVYDSRQHLAGVIVAGFAVDHEVARELKRLAGRSEFVFSTRGLIYASTLSDHATGNIVRHLRSGGTGGLVSDGTAEYVPFSEPLVDVSGQPAGQMHIFRSFGEARESVSDMRRRIFVFWGAAVVTGLLLTYLAAERVVKPLKELDHAASEVAMQNYSYRVRVDSEDEFGRLGTTFNRMCDSIQNARAELIRRERITAIGRLASSIVHDLRNPLAAIYGGAELLVDTAPTAEQRSRIHHNIYRASRRIQDLLEDLIRVTRGREGGAPAVLLEAVPVCLASIVADAVEALEAALQASRVKVHVHVPVSHEISADRTLLRAVFVNLIQNALDVMPAGGEVRIASTVEGNWLMVEVADTGPGIAEEIRADLFQPFVSHGKKSGLGLGLALARQTVLDHGGDLWAAPEQGPGRGARLLLRLPRHVASA
jgi:signal transduction histidine kinase